VFSSLFVFFVPFVVSFRDTLQVWSLPLCPSWCVCELAIFQHQKSSVSDTFMSRGATTATGASHVE
jgi:hypothetical protein